MLLVGSYWPDERNKPNDHALLMTFPETMGHLALKIKRQNTGLHEFLIASEILNAGNN